MVYLGVFSGDFFVEFALREVPERGTNWCAHDVFERDVPFLLVVVKKIEVVYTQNTHKIESKRTLLIYYSYYASLTFNSYRLSPFFAACALLGPSLSMTA